MPHSIMREIAHFEVALRNAYNRVMLEHWGGEIGCLTIAPQLACPS